MRKLQFVDLSGYGMSGKSALIELFREFDNQFHVPHYSFEFALLRMKDGLFDLSQALMGSWSPYRSDTAIKRFASLTNKIARNPSRFNVIGRLFSLGMRYDKYFNGAFLEGSMNYIENLIDLKILGLSPYPFQNMSSISYFFKKIAIKLSSGKVRASEEMFLTITDKAQFYSLTKEYLNSLFLNLTDHNATTFMLYNAFEPYNSLPFLDMFYDAKQIVVDRDPRDMYLTTMSSARTFSKAEKLICASGDVEQFVYRYRKLRESTLPNPDTNKIMRLNFEDLIFKYDETRNKVYCFLGKDESIHINQKKYFDPDLSVQGVGLWKTTSLKKEMDYISKNLKQYCRDY